MWTRASDCPYVRIKPIVEPDLEGLDPRALVAVARHDSGRPAANPDPLDLDRVPAARAARPAARTTGDEVTRAEPDAGEAVQARLRKPPMLAVNGPAHSCSGNTRGSYSAVIVNGSQDEAA